MVYVRIYDVDLVDAVSIEEKLHRAYGLIDNDGCYVVQLQDPVVYQRKNVTESAVVRPEVMACTDASARGDAYRRARQP